MPLIESAVISSRAKMWINGITLPARFRFTHDAGQAYRQYIEAAWMPSMWVTDSQVRRESDDEDTSELVVSFGEAEERFVVHFDPETDLIRSMESMCYKQADS